MVRGGEDLVASLLAMTTESSRLQLPKTSLPGLTRQFIIQEETEGFGHDATRKSEFDEDAFCGVERRDFHRSRKGSRGGKDAGAAGSLHPRQYASRRRHHGAGGFGRGGGDRDQSARGCPAHHHHREQDQLYRPSGT